MPNRALCRERILSENYEDFIIRTGRTEFLGNIAPEYMCEQRTDYTFQIIYVSETTVGTLNLERFGYQAIPKCYTTIDLNAMNQVGIAQLQSYPTLQLKGQGVMIGFIDTGIDYENPVFRNADGTTRISGIWDQTIQAGDPPEDLLYGTEYTREMIDEALSNEMPLEQVPTRDEDGHGTFLASLAAGGEDLINQFTGAAPNATIAVVKLKGAKKYLKNYYYINPTAVCYQENDIMLGLKYLNQRAKKENMPLVICIALGTNMGGHDGSSPLSGLLELYSQTANRIVVIGNGNEAIKEHHFQGRLREGVKEQTVEIRVDENVEGFMLELWTDIPNILAISMVSPSGERVPRVPIRGGTSAYFNFILDGTEVYVNYRFLVENTNSELVFFRFQDPSPGIWKILVEPVQITDGIFHMWLPVEAFQTGRTYFLRSNPDMTITNPGNSINPITVSYYNPSNRSISIDSSRGYTRLGIIKPDFAAPGVQILGATLNQTFAYRSGSSIGAGIVAGAAALLVEWILFDLGAPAIDSVQIKNLLILGTQRQEGIAYPNRTWGYGEVNLYHTFEVIRTY